MSFDDFVTVAIVVIALIPLLIGGADHLFPEWYLKQSATKEPPQT